MISVLKRLFNAPSDRPMERWSRDKLDGTKQYLEEKPPTEWTHEDHYLAVEYTVQRYLPAEDTRTESEYRASLEKLNRKVDWNIANPDAPKEEPAPDPDFAKWMEDQFQERFGHSMKR